MSAYSYQLYSSRNFQPLATTLAMLKETGYAAVEGYAGVFDNLDEFARELGAAHLKMPSAHLSIDALEQDQAGTLAIVEKLNVETVYCPYLAEPDRPIDAAGYRALGERLQHAGQFLVNAGIGFGWHNHDFEFQPLPDGSTPMDHIFAGGPDLEWEADIAWIARGGADPFEWIEKEKRRITAVHLKDLAPEGQLVDEDGWADLGQGTLAWTELLVALADAPVRYWIVEHDNPSDERRFAERSMAFLNSTAQSS